MRCVVLLCLLLAALCCTACGGKTYYAGVDALAAEDYKQQEDDVYMLLPYDAAVRADDLQFQEVARALRTVFLRQGMRLTDSLQSASCLAYVDYGLGETRTALRSTTTPIWGTRLVNGRNVDTVVGMNTDTRSYDVHTRYLRLYAHRKGKNAATPGPQLWQVSVSSSGTSDDFRSLLPALVQPLHGLLGVPTRGRRYFSVELPENEGAPIMEELDGDPEMTAY